MPWRVSSVDFRVPHCRPLRTSFTRPEKERRTRAAGDPELSESIFASLGAYFRTYLHALDKRAPVDLRARDPPEVPFSKRKNDAPLT